MINKLKTSSGKSRQYKIIDGEKVNHMKVQLRDRNSKKEMLVTKNTVREMNNALNNLISR